MILGKRMRGTVLQAMSLLFISMLAMAEEPEPSGDNHSHHEKINNSTTPGFDTSNPFFWRYTVIFICVAILLIIATLFDLGKEWLEEMCKEEFDKVLGKMFGELTLLGFIGLIMFFIDKKTTLLEKVSEDLFSHSEEDSDEAGKIVSELFEQVHMLLFLVMILYMLFVLFLIFQGRSTLSTWDATENRAEYCAKDIVKDYDAWRRSNPKTSLTDIYHLYRPPKVLVEMEYLLTRERFIHNLAKIHSTQLRGLPEHQFDFSKYLRAKYLDFLAETVDIPYYLWFIVILLIGIFYLLKLYFDFTFLSYLYIGITWFSVLVCLLVLHKMEGILDHLVPDTLSKFKTRKGSSHLLKEDPTKPLMADYGALENGSIQNGVTKKKKKKRTLRRQSSTMIVRTVLKKNMNDPKYWTNDMKEPDCVTKLFEWIHPYISSDEVMEPNKHERLFWFSYKGERFIMDFLCGIMILNSMFVAVFFTQFIFLMEAEQSRPTYFYVIAIALAVVPVLLQCFLLPYITDYTILSTSIEQMISKDKVSEVAVKCKTLRLFRTMLLYEIMSAYAKKVMKENGNTLPSSNLKAREIYKDDHLYDTKRQYLKDMFDEMDTDGSYSICEDEFTSLVMKKLRIVDTKAQAHNWFKKIDDDDSGQVEFDEFFDAWAQLDHSSDPTPKEVEIVAKNLFNAIDTDGSGCISADEFRGKLAELSLGEDLTEDDLSAIISEIDEDNNNRIDLHEFIQYVLHILDSK